MGKNAKILAKKIVKMNLAIWMGPANQAAHPNFMGFLFVNLNVLHHAIILIVMMIMENV
jgi:hypothetical protein